MAEQSLVRRTLDGVVRELTTGRVDMSFQRSLEIQSIRSEFEESFRYIELNHAEKLKNRLELSSLDYCIVSLGQNCLPRTLSTRWGIKKTRAEGELTCPFDLAIHTPSAIKAVLENSFAFYTEPQYFELSPDNIPKHTGYKIFFNHEKASEFIQNDFH